jgi:hypothetical protein
MRIRASALAGACVAAVAVGGCGGGDDGVSKSDYVKKGNAICDNYDKQVAALAKESFPNITQSNQRPTVPAFQAFLGKLLPLTEAEIRNLRALEKPKGDEQEIEAILAAADKGVAQARRGATDPTVARRLMGDVDPFADANRKAKAYGLKTCGS